MHKFTAFDKRQGRFSYFRFLRSLITAERGIQCLKPLLPPFSAADDKNSQMVEQIGRGGDGGHRGILGRKPLAKSINMYEEQLLKLLTVTSTLEGQK